MSVEPPAALRRLPRSRARGPCLRLAVRIRRRSLDLALAAGADAWSNRRLILRAEQLLRFKQRKKIAFELGQIVALAVQGPDPTHTYVQLRHETIARHREELLDLMTRLLDPAPVEVAAIAELRMLLRDGSSPILVGGRHPAELSTALKRCANRTRREPV